MFGQVIDQYDNDMYLIRYDDGNEEDISHGEVKTMYYRVPYSKNMGGEDRPKGGAGKPRKGASSTKNTTAERSKRKRSRTIREGDDTSKHGSGKSFEADTCVSAVLSEDDNKAQGRKHNANHVVVDGRHRKRRKRHGRISSSRHDNKLKRTVGTRVTKHFEGHGWFEGVVTCCEDDWTRVVYDDGDIEEYEDANLRLLEICDEGSRETYKDNHHAAQDREQPKFSVGTRVKKLFESRGWYWGIVTSFGGDVYRVMFDDGSINKFSEQELAGLIFR